MGSSVAEATAVLNGNIKYKGGTQYLSPLQGTITIITIINEIEIEEIDYNIRVKSLKQSEPIWYHETESGTPGSGDYWREQEWRCYVEVNIEENKYIGNLKWGSYHWEYGNETYDWQYSDLDFVGMADSKKVDCWLEGDLPEIY